MKMSQVEMIVEIANAGSISQAAQNLYVSQPSLSKALQRFEQEVGAQIFERVSTGVRLTPIGRKFVEQAADIVEQAEKFERMFDKTGSPASMELNFASVSYHFMQQMIPEVYNKYRQNPIVITYVECGFDEQLEMLKKGAVEIGVVSFWHGALKRGVRRAQAHGVEYHRVGDMQAYIAVSRHSKNYPESVEGVDLARLARMPLVSLSPFSPARTTGWDYMRQVFQENRLGDSNREIRTSSTGTMKEVLSMVDGFSLVVLNQGLYRQYGFFEDVRLIPISGEDMRFELGWLQRENTVRSPLANEFVSMLKEYSD